MRHRRWYWLLLLGIGQGVSVQEVLGQFLSEGPSRQMRQSMSHLPILPGVPPQGTEDFFRDRLANAQDLSAIKKLVENIVKDNEQPMSLESIRKLSSLVKKWESTGKIEGGDPELIRQLKSKANQFKLDLLKDKKSPHKTRERVYKDIIDKLLKGTHEDPTSTNKVDDSQPSSRAPHLPAPAHETVASGSLAGAEWTERFRNLADKIQDSPLGQATAWEKMIGSLTRLSTKAGAESWFSLSQRFERFGDYFADLDFSYLRNRWPQGPWLPDRSSLLATAKATSTVSSSQREGMGQAGILMIAFLASGAIVWFVSRSRRASVLPSHLREWQPGPWPVAPELVTSRQELVQAFEHLALLHLGLAARTRNHHNLAAGLAGDSTTRRQAAEHLAAVYEQARYAPPDRPIPETDIVAARQNLSLLAGEA